MLKEVKAISQKNKQVSKVYVETDMRNWHLELKNGKRIILKQGIKMNSQLMLCKGYFL